MTTQQSVNYIEQDRDTYGFFYVLPQGSSEVLVLYSWGMYHPFCKTKSDAMLAMFAVYPNITKNIAN